jgi:hypothetical protein
MKRVQQADDVQHNFHGAHVFYETGGVLPCWLYIKKKQKGNPSSDSRHKERKKENQKNYKRASSHSDIRGFTFPFALRITKANSLLKWLRQLSGCSCRPLKMRSFAASKYTNSG